MDGEQEDKGRTETQQEDQGTKVGNLESPDPNTPLAPAATVDDAKLPPQVVAREVQTDPNAIGTETKPFPPDPRKVPGLRLVAVPSHLTGGNLQLASALTAPRPGDLPPHYTPSGHVVVMRPAVTVASARQVTAMEQEIHTDAFNLFHKIRAYFGDFEHKFEAVLGVLHKTSIAPQDDEDELPAADPTLKPTPAAPAESGADPKPQAEA